MALALRAERRRLYGDELAVYARRQICEPRSKTRQDGSSSNGDWRIRCSLLRVAWRARKRVASSDRRVPWDRIGCGGHLRDVTFSQTAQSEQQTLRFRSYFTDRLLTTSLSVDYVCATNPGAANTTIFRFQFDNVSLWTFHVTKIDANFN